MAVIKPTQTTINNPTEIVAAQLVAPLKNAETAETPHPAAEAGAATSPWSRADFSPVATKTNVAVEPDALALQIRAAIDSVDLVDPSNLPETPTPSATFETVETPLTTAGGVELGGDEPQPQTALPIAEVEPIELVYWRAEPGAYLTTALEDWAEQSGWSVQNHSGSIWKITVPVELTGTFEDAAVQLVSGFGRTAPRPVIHLYPNKVLIIRRFDQREASNDQ